MGMTVDVFRALSGDFSNNGVSARHDRLVVVNVEGPAEPDDDRPAMYLEQGPGNGGWVLVPVAPREPGLLGPMFGGNYAATSDGRWRRAVGHTGAVPIHDRYETPDQYRSLSQ